MAATHEVQQGEHLAAIAVSYGFLTSSPIWDHPQNAKLRALRGNPGVLSPGDSLFIPDKQTKTESRPTTARHRFLVRSEKLYLRLTLLDVFGIPMSDVSCQLAVEGKDQMLTTDSEGRLDVEIPHTASTGQLKIKTLEIPIKIGHLDPVEDDSGLLARLTNLGYYRGALDPVDEMELRSAIEEFQCDEGLNVTGASDAATLDSLKEGHGC